MKTLFLLLPLFVAVTASAQKIIKIENTVNNSTRVFGNDFVGVIFPKEYNSQWISLKRMASKIYAVTDDSLNNEDIIGYNRFTPSKADIDSAESYLHLGLKRLYRRLPSVSFIKGPNIYRNLKNYARQYFGYVIKNHEKIILVNSFWDKYEINDTDWLQNYYHVYDGGNNYWNIKINLTTHKLFDFGVNGAI